MRREERELRALAARYGCTFEPTRAGHFRFVHPDGWSITCSGTPSDRKARANIVAALRRKSRLTDVPPSANNSS